MDAGPSLHDRKEEAARCVCAELEALRRSDGALAEGIAATCEQVLDACERGIPLRHLRECADVSDAGCLSLSARDIQLRSGPYPFHLRGFEQARIDDYTLVGEALLVGAKGAIASRDGKLLVVAAKGRFSASDGFHVVRPAPSDFEYLRHVLAGIDAQRYAKGTTAVRVIELADLRGAVVPWPAPDKRRTFADAMERCEQAGAAALEARLIDLWMLAVHDIDRLERAGAVPVPMEERAPHEDGSVDALAVADGLLAAAGASEGPMVDVVATTEDLADPASVQQGAACVCFPAPNQGTWTDRAVDEHDPRWAFGPPPRNKANYAWVQQTVACMGDGGRALMLLCNAALHSDSGREAAARRAWARSGLIEAVVALPGGLFADGRPPSSLVLMRRGRPSQDILFVNAQELGDDVGFAPSGAMARRLSPEAVERIVQTYAAWRRDGCADMPGFCRAVPPCELEANGCALTPWTYVGPR